MAEKKLIANNKKAYHDYFILEKYEAGIVLHGTEVKSLRMGKCSIKEAFIRIEDGEMFIYGMHISPYEKGNIFNKDPLRVRKLLLHKKEIDKIFEEIAGKLVVSEEYLSTQFKKETGMTFSETVRKYRIEKVKKLLLETPFKLNQIAELAGYSDSKYMSKVFKEEVGMLPSEYRKSLH